MRIGIGPGGNPGGPGETLEDPGGPRCSSFAMLAEKNKPPGTQDGCHRCLGCHGCHGCRGCHGSRGSGVKNCCSEPTSTRAGGQDDGSYTNSHKLLFIFNFYEFWAWKVYRKLPEAIALRKNRISAHMEPWRPKIH